MKEMLEKLNSAFEELRIEKIENIELLLNLTKEDVEKGTDISYQVTPILEQLLKLSRVYLYLDDELNELFTMNQTYFFSKIEYIAKLSEKILDEFKIRGIIHPILASDFEFEDTLDSQEECAFVLEEIKEILEKMDKEKEKIDDFEFSKNPLLSQISTYYDRVVGYYQMVFSRQVIPKLREDMFLENYQHAIEVLFDYVNLKLKLLSGMDDDNSIYLTDVAMNLHESLDHLIVEDVYNRIEIEGAEFDPEELEEEEYLNLLILRFENRYQRQKTCRYYYHEKLLETEMYKEKCKKM